MPRDGLEEPRWLLPREWQIIEALLFNPPRTAQKYSRETFDAIVQRLGAPPVRVETVADKREVVARALKARLPIAFDYPDHATRADTGHLDPTWEPRLVWPHQADDLVFGGYDYDRDAYRSFRVDRARNVQVHTEGPPQDA